MPQLVKLDTKSNKPVVDTKTALITSLKGQIPRSSWNYKDHLNLIQSLVLAENNSVSSAAISNCRGSWYETMLAIDLFNHWYHGDSNYLMIQLPNIMRFDRAKLYKNDIKSYIDDLTKKLKDDLDIELITSNPDFVMIDTTDLVDKSGFSPILTITPYEINFIENLYKTFIGKCSFNDIVAYMATKTSLRPDRRLQIVHEGSLTKAFYVHLQTRLWLAKPRGIQYFGASLSLNDKDKRALKTVATHSITTVLSEPERAVDDCFQLASRDDLYKALTEMTKMIPTR